MLFEALDNLKRQTIMTSIIMMALGIVMVIFPDDYVGSLVSLLGYVLLTLATFIIMDFLAGKKSLIHYIYLTVAIVAGIFGMAILIFPNDLIRLLRWIFGIVLILSGLSNFINSCTYLKRAGRKTWWILAALSLSMIVLSVIIISNPWWDTMAELVTIIGWMLIYSAIVGIVHLIYVWPIKKAQGSI